MNFPYIWAWGPGLAQRLPGRKGQRCRVLIRGARNSALIEFEDGYRAVTSRSGIRAARACPERSRGISKRSSQAWKKGFLVRWVPRWLTKEAGQYPERDA